MNKEINKKIYTKKEIEALVNLGITTAKNDVIGRERLIRYSQKRAIDYYQNTVGVVYGN